MVQRFAALVAKRFSYRGANVKPPFEDLSSKGKQAIQIPSLRNALPGPVHFWERSAFQERYFFVVIR